MADQHGQLPIKIPREISHLGSQPMPKIQHASTRVPLTAQPAKLPKMSNPQTKPLSSRLNPARLDDTIPAHCNPYDRAPTWPTATAAAAYPTSKPKTDRPPRMSARGAADRKLWTSRAAPSTATCAATSTPCRASPEIPNEPGGRSACASTAAASVPDRTSRTAGLVPSPQTADK